jgi:hypothetical protein
MSPPGRRSPAADNDRAEFVKKSLTDPDPISVHHADDIGEQLDLLYLGRAARDQGVEQAIEATDDWWRDCCDRGIAELARRGHDFQAADLTALGVPDPDHPNRWGARLHLAARRGVIEPVGFAQSHRPTVKASIVRTWRGTSS